MYGTHDNLIFLTQKVAETLNRSKKVIAIFFDIAKAFDSVWHKGLIHKLMEYSVPTYIVNWIEDFLKDRSFYVDIDGIYTAYWLVFLKEQL